MCQLDSEVLTVQIQIHNLSACINATAIDALKCAEYLNAKKI